MRSSIADYEVIEPLGPTPSGRERYLCTPPERLGIGEPVMVTELAVGADGWPRLVDDLARFASVRCEQLVQIIEVAPDLDATVVGVFIATEAGRALSVGGHASSDEPVAAVAAVARGAHSLHEAGIVHGGIDGWSALVTSRGPVLWPAPLDEPAGLVARCRDPRKLAMVDPGLLRGESPTRWSDVWSLGALLHEVSSETSLYPGIETEDSSRAVLRIAHSRPEIDPGLAEPLSRLIAECLSVDPEARPETADRVAERIIEIGDVL